MTTIRIDSNPYEQTIKYYILDESINEYKELDCNSNSSFVSERMQNCFFPFKAYDILQNIMNEFAVKSELKLVFNGASDEYNELCNIINSETDKKFNKVILEKGEKYLENGRDIIEQINDIYKLIEPIIKLSIGNNERINKNMQKFVDAANDIIPICVIGNTNMGKSTLINALIGGEYLPQDKDRCTAKVYKITQSKYIDRASINFEYDKIPVTINFKDTVEITGNISDDFKNSVFALSEESREKHLSEKVSCLLKLLNKYNEEKNSQNISDLISIEVPFNSDVLQKANNPFVIFDTPGSNYAGNKKDAELLKEQMEGLSNGLPVFVTDYSGLSSNDNDILIEKLQSLDELDQRFTIIVVNKADDARLDNNEWDEDEENKTKSLPVPRKLEKTGLQGFYFVSSIVGLGYKNKSNFSEHSNYKVYKKNLCDFDGSCPEDTLELHKFNILPTQIKAQFEENIPDEINPVYLNSGLYSIEKEIETYANTYSAYNKCQQAYLFLNNVFSETESEIIKKNKSIENETEALNSNFDKEKRKLLEKIKTEKEAQSAIYISEQNKDIEDKQELDIQYFNIEELKETESNIYDNRKDEFSIDNLSENYDKQKSTIISDLKENLSKLGNDVKENLKQKDFSSATKNLFGNFAKTAENFGKNVKDTVIEGNKLGKNIREVQKAAYDEGLKEFMQLYFDIQTEQNDSIYNSSNTFWKNKSEQLKNRLIEIVALSEALAEEQKTVVKSIIADYRKIELRKEEVDTLENKRYRNIFSKRIDVKKIWVNLNSEMNKSVKFLSSKTALEHQQEFERWADNLLDEITLHIGGMNPTLKLYLDKIAELKNQKLKLERNQLLLKEYKQQIESLISWKELA